MRYLVVLLSVILVLPLWAMSKEASERVCQTNINTLEAAQSSLTGEVQQAFSFVLAQLRDNLEKLKRSGKHEDIYNYRSLCDKGYYAALWMMESSGISPKDGVKREDIREDKDQPAGVSAVEVSTVDEKSKESSLDNASVKTPAQVVSLKKTAKAPKGSAKKITQRTEKKKANVKDAKSTSTTA